MKIFNKQKEPDKSAGFSGKTASRILEALDSGKTMTASQLAQYTKTTSTNTREAVEFLEQLGVVETMTNGRTMLVKKTEVVQ